MRSANRQIRGSRLRQQEGGRVLLTEIPLPRIARQGTACLISARGQVRKYRIDKFEFDEGFQPYHPPFRSWPQLCLFHDRVCPRLALFSNPIHRPHDPASDHLLAFPPCLHRCCSTLSFTPLSPYKANVSTVTIQVLEHASPGAKFQGGPSVC